MIVIRVIAAVIRVIVAVTRVIVAVTRVIVAVTRVIVSANSLVFVIGITVGPVVGLGSGIGRDRVGLGLPSIDRQRGVEGRWPSERTFTFGPSKIVA